MNEKLQRLLIPEGVRDLLPDTARQKRKLGALIQDIFSRWGYREVSTPAFEYSDSFTAGMKAELRDNVFRFFDEYGKTLVLRPDYTLPLARVAAMHFANAPKPLRLCYGGEIFRYNAGEQGKQRETTQAGVELIGDDSACSDAEIIALAVEVFLASGLEDFVLCLGHIGFLDTLLAAHGLGPDEAARIKLLFSKKDFVALQEEVKRMKISEEAGRSILQVPHLRGGAEVFAAARELLPPGRGTAMLAALQSVWEVLEDYGADSYVTLDLGLVRMLDYYTGMVFEGYTSGFGYPLCGGGCYDRLFVNFGPDMPAVGFAINIDHLLAVLQRQQKLPPAEELSYLAYGKGGRAAAIAAALKQRARGINAVVATAEAAFSQAEQEAAGLGACRLFYYTGDGALEKELRGGENDGK